MLRAIAILAVCAISLPASAHTTEELEAWEADYNQRVLENGFNLGYAIEFRDMVQRHLWYFHPKPKNRNAPRGNTGMGTNVEQWRGLVAAYFPNETDLALCVMKYESGGNPNATNPSSGAAGLFQIMPFWWTHYGGDRYDPETNVATAAKIRASQGWTAWMAYNRGRC